MIRAIRSPWNAASPKVSAAARARQERLLRRMQEADYLFRNICRNCGGSIEGPGAYDPVDPPSRLGGARPAPAAAPTAAAPEPAPEQGPRRD